MFGQLHLLTCPQNTPFQMKEVQKLLQDIGRRDVNQPASSPWASPFVLLVRKKVGSLRFCINYRNLNGITYTQRCLPRALRINDTLDSLAGSTRFTTLDLVSGYWQVEVSDKDWRKTAFCTQERLFPAPDGLSIGRSQMVSVPGVSG